MTIIIKNVRSEVVKVSSAITIKAIAIHWGFRIGKKKIEDIKQVIIEGS